MSKTYWQIAAGSAGRNYSDYFLKFGMAFVGGEVQINTMNKVEEGDIVLIKYGRYQVVAAGEVIERDGKYKGCGDKSWLRDFDGWDLEAYCYVDWHVPDQPIETDGLTRATIQRTPQDKHKHIANSLLQLPVSSPEPEPSETNIIRDDTILDFLITEGLRPSAADELTNTFRRIRLLANYYYNKSWCKDIREHETRTFLVVPLLLTLGWAEQQLKIELPCSKGKIDIACFSKAYKRNNEDCVLIVETKDFSSGLDYAPEQAHKYAEEFKSCQVVVVTNGYCYKSYVRNQDGSFSTAPSAYLNILKPKDRYPLDPQNVDGALEILKWLLPNTLR